MLPQVIFEKEHSETFFSSVSGNQASVSQAKLELLKKSKLRNENRQMVRDGEGGKATTEF